MTSQQAGRFSTGILFCISLCVQDSSNLHHMAHFKGEIQLRYHESPYFPCNYTLVLLLMDRISISSPKHASSHCSKLFG